MTVKDNKGNPVADMPPLTPLQRDMILHMVANLIGDKDRVKEIEAWGITPDLIPETDFELRVAKRIFEQMIQFRFNHIQPTKENLINFLNGSKPLWLEGKEPDQIIDNLLLKQTFDRQVSSIAAGLADWIQKQKGLQAAQGIEKLYRGSLPNIEAYDRAVELLKQARPTFRTHTGIVGSELFSEWKEKMLENYQLKQSGKLLGPRFPWKSTWGYLPFMRKGELTLLFAQLKFGKSQLVAAVSEYVAYQLGFDVLHMHLEIDRITLQSRMMARELVLPINEMEQGWYLGENGEEVMLPLHKEPWVTKINKLEKWIAEREKTHGQIIYFHCPGASVAEIEVEVARRVAESNARGRGLLVVIDYYNRIRWEGTSEAHGLNRVASELKDMASSHDAYFLVVAQDDPDNGYEKEITVRGAKEIAVVGQVLCRVERRLVEEDEPDMPVKVLAGNEWVQRMDSIGRPMYYHRQGDFHSVTTLNFLRANNNAKGKPKIRMMGGYFFIESYEPKIVDVNKDS